NVTVNINGNRFVNSAVTGDAMVGITNGGPFGEVNINNNLISGNTSAATQGGFVGLSNNGSVINVLNINNNDIGTESDGAVTFSVPTSAAIGISNGNGRSSTRVNISGNTLR